MDKYARLFKEEVTGILSDIELLAMQLRDNPGNSRLIDLLKDSFRRVKKNVSMFGFDHLASFAQDVELVLDKVRKGTIPVTPRLIGLTISARDNIGEHIANFTDKLDNDSIWVALELEAVSGDFSLSKARETSYS
jgi:chemotaxis protein histidine kinase CheA